MDREQVKGFAEKTKGAPKEGAGTSAETRNFKTKARLTRPRALRRKPQVMSATLLAKQWNR
jgi:hypothetical protein